jgi:hypothetical protein
MSKVMNFVYTIQPEELSLLVKSHPVFGPGED